MLSSALAYQAVPYFATYSANKAYVLTLGEALHYELKRSGVDVTVLSPGLTDTAMTTSMDDLDWSRTPIKLLSTESVVKTALNALGRKPSVIPGRRNNLFAFVSRKVRSRKGITSMFGGMMEKAIDKEHIELAKEGQESPTEIRPAA